MKVLKSINNTLILISKFLCLLGGIMLIAMMLITSVDVGLRTFVHSAFNGASVGLYCKLAASGSKGAIMDLNKLKDL